MKNKVFCVGKDTHDIKVDDLKNFGLTWGCSNAYGNWIPDRLVNIDVGLSHEIYRSGYCIENECYFWEWVKHDASFLSNLRGNDDLIDHRILRYMDEAERHDGAEKFVIHGFQLFRTKQILDKLEGNSQEYIDKIIDASAATSYPKIWLTWCQPEDKAYSTSIYSLKQIWAMSHFMTYPEDRLLGEEALSVFLASFYDYADEIFLLGHNISKEKWKKEAEQLKFVCQSYPDINYYKVENTYWPEHIDLHGIENLKFITQDVMWEKVLQSSPNDEDVPWTIPQRGIFLRLLPSDLPMSDTVGMMAVSVKHDFYSQRGKMLEVDYADI